MKRAEYYIKKLNLTSHPEGGYYREIYRSDEIIETGALPERYTGTHSFSTSIYYLLKSKKKSNLHKLKSDEIWHFYEGSPLRLFIINKDGSLSEFILGKNLEAGEVFQGIIKKDNWFCAEVIKEKSFTLCGCTVSPGFDFSDFTLGKRKDLLKDFPQHKDLIINFTKD